MAVVLSAAFCFALLNVEGYTAGVGSSVFIAYALLMHADGVGESDQYMNDSIFSGTLLITLTLFVDIVIPRLPRPSPH